MAAFPKLKTNAAVQYPIVRETGFANGILRFLDGSEQRYPLRIARRRWVIRLDLLDASEIRDIDEFFTSQQGRFGSFSFTDPADQAEYSDCSLDQDDLTCIATDELRHRTHLVIRQNG
jgi:hypothetical protein